MCSGVKDPPTLPSCFCNGGKGCVREGFARSALQLAQVVWSTAALLENNLLDGQQPAALTSHRPLSWVGMSGPNMKEAWRAEVEAGCG